MEEKAAPGKRSEEKGSPRQQIGGKMHSTNTFWRYSVGERQKKGDF
jgi:hypothetical protein